MSHRYTSAAQLGESLSGSPSSLLNDSMANFHPYKNDGRASPCSRMIKELIVSNTTTARSYASTSSSSNRKVCRKIPSHLLATGGNYNRHQRVNTSGDSNSIKTKLRFKSVSGRSAVKSYDETVQERRRRSLQYNNQRVATPSPNPSLAAVQGFFKFETTPSIPILEWPPRDGVDDVLMWKSLKDHDTQDHSFVSLLCKLMEMEKPNHLLGNVKDHDHDFQHSVKKEENFLHHRVADYGYQYGMFGERGLEDEHLSNENLEDEQLPNTSGNFQKHPIVVPPIRKQMRSPMTSARETNKSARHTTTISNSSNSEYSLITNRNQRPSDVSVKFEDRIPTSRIARISNRVAGFESSKLRSSISIKHQGEQNSDHSQKENSFNENSMRDTHKNKNYISEQNSREEENSREEQNSKEEILHNINAPLANSLKQGLPELYFDLVDTPHSRKPPSKPPRINLMPCNRKNVVRK